MNLALIITLLISLTGLWPHLDTTWQQRLLHQTTIQAAPAISLPPPVPLATVPKTQLSLETGTSAYAIDAATGQVLYAQNATTPRPIASITKLMTVMVALNKLKPTDIVTVGQLPDYDVADETMGLQTGQKLTVLALVKATLIASDNDAADALGLATSGQLPAFYAAMNAKAAQWGIKDAHFASATGLVDKDNIVSAAALAKIAALDLTNPLIRQVVATPTATVRDAAGLTYNLKTTNDLLATGQFYGIKTGYTEAAGECFVGLTTFRGHEVITVVLGSRDRFGETQTLVTWIGHNWSWQ